MDRIDGFCGIADAGRGEKEAAGLSADFFVEDCSNAFSRILFLRTAVASKWTIRGAPFDRVSTGFPFLDIVRVLSEILIFSCSRETILVSFIFVDCYSLVLTLLVPGQITCSSTSIKFDWGNSSPSNIVCADSRVSRTESSPFSKHL